MRGYGESDLPADITAYNQWDVSHDILGLVSALGYEQAVVIGHDWGAPTAWNCALLIATVRRWRLSVPFSPRGTEPPLGMLKQVFEGQFFYQLYFQTPGVAEAEFEANIEHAPQILIIWPPGSLILPCWVESGVRMTTC